MILEEEIDLEEGIDLEEEIIIEIIMEIIMIDNIHNRND